jgi:hypothetical protein
MHDYDTCSESYVQFSATCVKLHHAMC